MSRPWIFDNRGVRLLQADDQLQQDALHDPTLPEDRNGLARIYAEVDSVQARLAIRAILRNPRMTIGWPCDVGGPL